MALRKLIVAGIILWLVLTAGLLLWAGHPESWAATPAAPAADSARQATERDIREALAANPDLLLDVLRRNSETLLDIVQEGAILRRNKTLIAGWKADLATPKTIKLERRLSRGPADAPVTVVAYSDFTCPYCEQAAANMKTLLEESKNIRYVFKSFPLGGGHGRLAAEYFVAAGLQGSEKAWKFYDLLFSLRERLTREGEPVLKKAAQEAGLDLRRLAADAKSRAVRDMVDEDMAEAARLGVEGTPTTFVNNLVVRGALAPELFARAVNMALEEAQKGADAASAKKAEPGKASAAPDAAKP